MPYPVGFDASSWDKLTISQLSLLAGGLTAQEYVFFRQELKRRFGFDMPASLEAEPNNLVESLLRTSKLFQTVRILGAGGAGNFSQFMVFNPVGSGIRIQYFQLAAIPTAAATVRIYHVNNTSSWTGGAGDMSCMNIAGGAPLGQQFESNNQVINGLGASGLGFVDVRPNAAGALAVFNDNIQMPLWEVRPGEAISIVDQTANEACTFIVRWAELPFPGPATV